MSQVVGTYSERASADVARRLLMEAGYFAERVALLSPRTPGSSIAPLHLRSRNELMLRKAVRWGIIGALITEVPLIVALLLIPVDVNVKVLLASTVWKFGASFGAWLGAMAASDRGLETELALRYETLLNNGHWVLSAQVAAGDRSYVRGAMLESDASDVRDVNGTFEFKPPTPSSRRYL